MIWKQGGWENMLRILSSQQRGREKVRWPYGYILPVNRQWFLLLAHGTYWKLQHPSLCEWQFYLPMLRSSVTQKLKLKRKFLGALVHTSEISNLKERLLSQMSEHSVQIKYVWAVVWGETAGSPRWKTAEKWKRIALGPSNVQRVKEKPSLKILLKNIKNPSFRGTLQSPLTFLSQSQIIPLHPLRARDSLWDNDGE